MRYFSMKVFYMFYSFHYVVGYLIFNYNILPLEKSLLRIFSKSAWIRKRWQRQGRTYKQVDSEAITTGYNSAFDMRYGSVVVSAEVLMGLLSTGLLVDIVMIPQLFIATPYFAFCMRNYHEVCIASFLGIGYLLCDFFICHDGKYIPYFKEFMLESKRKRWCWHVVSVLTAIAVVLAFVHLTTYCMNIPEW